ncbi:nitrate- and nitrite sensing domain-containing protein [Actinomadura sp. LOL_016]|uniref:sensor histidine kinase n=1 Tax=unclassified Actinomadura TaxID=2626254 RepID=UPI003A80FDDD
MLSLTALWVFAAWVTLREGVNLLGVSTLDSALAQPTDPLIAELQRERRLSMVQLARPSTATRSALAAQREQTDKARTEAVERATGGRVDWFADDTLEERRDEMLERLKSLETSRRIVDARSGERDQVNGQYSGVITSIFEVYDALATLDDEAFARDTRLLLELNRTWELLSQEDALLAGALVTGRMSDAEMVEFTQIVGTRRHNLNAALNDVRESDATVYADLTKNEKIVGIVALEDRITQGYRIGRPTRTGVQPPVTAEQWNAAAEPALAEMRTKIQGAGDRLVDRATPIAAGVILRLALAGGLGLLAVIASVVVSITTARALVRQLERLRGAALELAEQRLPGVVERLGHGEKVDVAIEAPPLQFGGDEIGQVGRAFNVVQETAIRTAVEQAELRRGIRDVLLSLARRTQTLVHRQLTMLDTMERRRDIETKELEELFRLDHLATRMRRNAENLIVLSGALPARGWRNPVPMVDVIRAAVGEVEDYTRVSVLPFGPIGLAGRAVGDVTHLLAELIENAVSFSPPDTVVQVGGHLVGNGFAIDIEDRGLGMTDEKLAEINQRIADPPDFNLQSSVQLGLFVVSKLAERYGLQVMLKRSAYGGTTAVVVIPSELIVEQPEDRHRGPAQATVKSGATTPNGLEVRQPAAVGAATPAPGPALVAVPGGPGPEPANGDGAADAPRAPQGDDRAPVDETRSPVDVPPPAPPADTGERPVTIEPEDLPPVPDISTTPSGLPVRVPQANLAEPLRTDEPTAAAQQPDEDDDPGRSPEEIKRIMGSYQRGSRQGRSDAAATLGNTEGEEEQ